MHWLPLSSLAELDALLAQSANGPVAIFKHSTSCSISALAKTRLERQWPGAVGNTVRAYYLDLLRHRPVSNAVAQTLGIEHESPQLLLIQDGRCTYHASHMEIRVEALKAIIGG